MKIYQIDNLAFYTGVFVEQEEHDPIPLGYVYSIEEPPVGDNIRWNGTGWSVSEFSHAEIVANYSNEDAVPPSIPPYYGPSFTLNTWDDVRRGRNELLALSDWTQSRDVLLSNDEEWKAYRQELRDLPDRYLSIKTIDWPPPPSSN